MKPETMYPCSTEMKADLRNCRSVNCTMRKKCGVKGRATKRPETRCLMYPDGYGPHMHKQTLGSPLIPNLPSMVTPPEVTMRHQFAPDAVLWLGALAMNDGRTMFVFDDGGHRRAVAIRGSICELTEVQTEREIERSRKRMLAVEASLDTIYYKGITEPAPKPAPEQVGVPVESIDEFIERKREADPTLEPEPEPERKVIGDFNNMDPLPSWEATPELLEGRPSEKIEGWVDESDRA